MRGIRRVICESLFSWTRGIEEGKGQPWMALINSPCWQRCFRQSCELHASQQHKSTGLAMLMSMAGSLSTIPRRPASPTQTLYQHIHPPPGTSFSCPTPRARITPRKARVVPTQPPTLQTPRTAPSLPLQACGEPFKDLPALSLNTPPAP